MDSVFIAARAGVDENAAAPSATVAGPNSASLRVIVMGTSLSRETLPQVWRAGEGMSSGKVACAARATMATIPQAHRSNLKSIDIGQDYRLGSGIVRVPRC